MKRPCIESGCPNLTDRTRCTEHQNQHQLERGYTPAYKAEHAAQRKAWAERVATGTVTCSRCPHPILPGQAWDIDRRPWGFEPAHAECNRSAGARHEP